MHKWSFLLIACLAAIQSIASITDRRFFNGRQQCSRSGQIRNIENLFGNNLNRKNPGEYRLNFWDSNRDNQQFRRNESRMNRLNRNINHGHIKYRVQTLGRPKFIRDNVFDEIRNSRERSIVGDRRFDSRDNRRSFDIRAEVTEDRYSRLARDRSLVLHDHNRAKSENQRRWYSERDLVFRDQTRANRDIRGYRRTDVRNQISSTTERNGISERHFERNIVFRDQARAKREIRDNRRTDVRNQMRLANEGKVNNERNRIADRYSERDQLRANRDIRDNRRTDVHNLIRSTTESNIVLRDEARENREIRDNRRKDIRNQLRFATKTNVESERNLVIRDQIRANRVLRDNRRTEIRYQLRTTPERYVDSERNGFLGKYSERLVFRDQTRANCDNRDNRKAQREVHSEIIGSSKILQRFAENSQTRVILKGQRRSSDLATRKPDFLRNTPQRQREFHQNRDLLTVRENRSDDLKQPNPIRVSREIDVRKRERNIFTRNDLREDKSAARQDARSQFFRINRSDSKMGYRNKDLRFESRIQMLPEKHNKQETSTFLPWYYVMYSLQAIYIYSIMSQLFTKTKGKKTCSHFTDMAFSKQIKAE